ncbi:TonB-linked outer membrane protein, SusC/RagA family [Catalinimonas alkaloidigena]|uniref:TonB-linked outer membrane protein, SusC/RagA family n=1 Tax=Catalinimonas alkaloidigena TaxID=1075417 RepID=A0A1G9A6S1_9BACT|nr:TonB-dependent receptor [Catalinimonas alkaloidigena]SDK22295.1 TonB-linked outer membrane protein, SusC/RagA family [Catalinimonas alkaloidigena]
MHTSTRRCLGTVGFLLALYLEPVGASAQSVVSMQRLTQREPAARQEAASPQQAKRSLADVLTELKSDYGVYFMLSDDFSGQRVTLHRPYQGSLDEQLSKIQQQTGLQVRQLDERNFLLFRPLENDARPTKMPQPLVVPAPSPALVTLQRIPQVLLDQRIVGQITDASGEGIPGVNILEKGTSNGTITDVEGRYTLSVSDNATLVISAVGYLAQEVEVGNQTTIDVTLEEDIKSLNEVVVIGYGAQKRESVTGSIASIQSKDIDRVHASTVSATLAGKIPGVSFRQAEGRPGSGALVQVRNMGDPLFVIDGIQKDAGQFNNLSPNDIESITVLKDASASVYGSRAANGVVIVTTKKGKTGEKPTINIDSYYGWQNWTRFPRGVDAYSWMVGKADAEVNQTGNTVITAEELQKWQQGTELGYRSFDWYDFIVGKNAPQYSLNANVSGGSEKTNYYLSVTHLNQDAVLKGYNFNRTNIQSNIDTRIAERLKVGVQINGRIESRKNPGVPGGDDYWAPRFALFRNRPTERPYANDNPLYPNDIGHNAENWAILNYDISGYNYNDWRVLQTNFNAEYELPIKGLTARGMYSYYLADNLANIHEYTYDVYTYDPNTDTYNITGGSSNPYRLRESRKVLESVGQLQLNYNNSFGKHTVGGTFVYERIQRRDLYTRQHAVPSTNVLPVLQFSEMDAQDFVDSDYQEARIGYVGRVTYNFADKYFLELAGRRDASWKFAPGRRWGFFPSVSAGWRISEEEFFQNMLGGSTVLNDLKLRASYGKLGDDNINMGIDVNDPRYLDPFAYISGYTYPVSTTRPVILDGITVLAARDRGVPITNLSWFTSNLTDIGLDFTLLNGRLSGAVDGFYRKRTGLRGSKYDILLPSELGYSLPEENVSSDAQMGGDGNLAYQGQIRGVEFTVGGNLGYSRSRFLQSYKPQFGNSWDHYRYSIEDRWNDILWGYEVIGQFQSQEEVNSYPINVDGQGNRTLLPGDFIYRDVNDDGVINSYDQRPIGYRRGGTPIISYGANFSFRWKGFDLTADFSGGSMYTYNQNWEMRWPYQNTGNLLANMYDDRWHRADPLDPNSAWIPGKNPPLRFNDGNHSNYRRDELNGNGTSTDWWAVNVRYLRLRTLELGYSLPRLLTEKVKVNRARVYINTYNLLSVDNVKQFGIDPEIENDNGLQYPQNRLVNLGVNLSF